MMQNYGIIALDVSGSTGITVTGGWTQSTSVSGYYGTYTIYQ
jgi:hypothetical protein